MKTHDRRGRKLRTAPVTTAPIPIRATEHQLRVLELDNRFRYLPTGYFKTLLDWEGKYYIKVICRLVETGHLYYPPDSWIVGNPTGRDAVVGITRAGKELLAEHGLLERTRRPTSKGDDNKLKHELGVALIASSFEIGAKAHGLEFITHTDILNHERTPVETRKLDAPFSLPTRFEFTNSRRQTRPIEKDVRTDGNFFGLAKRHEKGRTTILIPGFEFDRDSEPLKSDNTDRPTIELKFRAFRQLLQTRLYENRFGFPRGSFYFLFITINDANMRGMMRVLSDMTNGKGSERFAFKSIPSLNLVGRFPEPSGHMIEDDWQRVGHPPLNILKELGCT